MILAGAGLYMAYTPFNAMLFDRLIAYSGRVATAGFLIYVADASGYVGSVALLLARNFGGFHLDWLRFFTLSAYATSIVGAVLTVLAAAYFSRGRRRPAVVVSMMRPAFTSATDLETFLRGLADSPSDEEGLTELEHLLQCADVLREAYPDDAELQVAGLLHDVGWSLDPAGDHGRLGADAVRGLVGERAAELVRLHVDAKRYLVTCDAGYRAKLSPVSVATLALQGAEMSPPEIAAFEANPCSNARGWNADASTTRSTRCATRPVSCRGPTS